MTTTTRPGQVILSQPDPPLTTHFTPDPSCTGWHVNTPRGSGSGLAAFTSEVCGTMRTGRYPSTSSDIVDTGHATALYLIGPTISPRIDPVPTTFKTATRSPSDIVPSSSHSPVRLISRSAPESSTNVGAGMGGGLGGAALLGLGIYLFLRYRKRRITQGEEEDKPVSPEPDHHQGYGGSQPKPERTPSPISGPEVAAEKPESVSLSDRQGPVGSIPSGLIELEAAPVTRAVSPLPQGDGYYTDRSAEGTAIQAPSPSPGPAELPGSEVSIAELESPHLTATSPATTMTAISTAASTSTTTAATTTPTVTRAPSGRGGSQAPAQAQRQRAASPRAPAPHASRAISPALSMFSYGSAAPSEAHSLNEDAPRVLNPEERRRQLAALQEEARRREEEPPRRI